MANKVTMDELVALAKNRGFIFPGSDIYGGLANSWDYGPYGIALKNNIKKAWWQKFIQESPYNVGIDAAILMNPRVWEASGHLSNFNDPLIDCKNCKTRHRADQLIEAWWNTEAGASAKDAADRPLLDALSNEELVAYIKANDIICPNCGKHDFTDVRQFNLMFKTFQGVTEDSQSEIYLRPETAQGIFVNFNNVQRSSRKKIPFGIGQIGKSFRNEITPGNFIFRTREFEQMELEFFCEPGTDDEWFEYWKSYCFNFLLEIGVTEENLRMRDHDPKELSHYSKGTTDIEYKFPFNWGELWGIANRTDYDLTQHMEHSSQDMNYFDPEKNEKYVPYVVEPSVGADRLLLAVYADAYAEEELEGGDSRSVLRFHPAIAPVKIAILPLSKKLTEEAEKLHELLSPHYAVELDERQSIGKRYRRQDEIGTPYCVTIDFDSLEDNAVTIRHRDTMEQVRVPIAELLDWFSGKFDL
ncbi:glycine--tRNA ligase [Fastidiosipila sanguinis]|uniref:Glycine--tRNA ligase n=1 Tax=Fastidiosipila sanguinis TaxID=236753 RepID=A0A2S0KPW2_9FIRM|nr:glycine--tRNA ligase [Fastidiosipila sanguinis]AVM43039.1 glycine--tRNA ligase [Fastidiosipila sanguinis]